MSSKALDRAVTAQKTTKRDEKAAAKVKKSRRNRGRRDVSDVRAVQVEVRSYSIEQKLTVNLILGA
ncbi:hypothetical protein C8Q75DRAFT_747940 [Abortiporus biennis]|nr:hypothetical protein C8Q75DRAFT_747940 [Abortiporus biennis]